MTGCRFGNVLLTKLVIAVCVTSSATPAFSEGGFIAHFVAPSYPPLARQAMIAGQVVLRLSIAHDGEVLDVKDDASPHPLLLQEARDTVRQWQFHQWPRMRSVAVIVYFGLSGRTRDSNPRTVVKADFALSTIRVYVTTDGVPTVRP